MRDIGHLIGNPLFAIETNLDPLRKRIRASRKTPELTQADEIVDDLRSSVEQMKTALDELKTEREKILGSRDFSRGDRVVYLPAQEVYEFGYMGQTGKAIIYICGERNMQDAIAVDPTDIIKISTPGGGNDE